MGRGGRQRHPAGAQLPRRRTATDVAHAGPPLSEGRKRQATPGGGLRVGARAAGKNGDGERGDGAGGGRGGGEGSRRPQHPRAPVRPPTGATGRRRRRRRGGRKRCVSRGRGGGGSGRAAAPACLCRQRRRNGTRRCVSAATTPTGTVSWEGWGGGARGGRDGPARYGGGGGAGGGGCATHKQRGRRPSRPARAPATRRPAARAVGGRWVRRRGRNGIAKRGGGCGEGGRRGRRQRLAPQCTTFDSSGDWEGGFRRHPAGRNHGLRMPVRAAAGGSGRAAKIRGWLGRRFWCFFDGVRGVSGGVGAEGGCGC